MAVHAISTGTPDSVAEPARTELGKGHFYALQLVSRTRSDEEAFSCMDLAEDFWVRIRAEPVINHATAAMKIDAVLDYLRFSGGAPREDGSDTTMLEEVSRFLRGH